MKDTVLLAERWAHLRERERRVAQDEVARLREELRLAKQRWWTARLQRELAKGARHGGAGGW
jgi:hypothetical protein